MDMTTLLRTSHSRSHRVETGDTALAYGSGGIDVLATPALVALIEETARDAIQPALADGHTSVGTLVHIRHVAPTPVGRVVRVTVTITEVEGRRVTFQIGAEDDAGPVCEGSHERVVVEASRFADKVGRRYTAS